VSEAAPTAPRYTIQWEPLDAILDDKLIALLVENYAEIETDHDVVELDPDWARAYALEEMGVLRILTLRCDDELVGYNAFHVMPHIHAQSTSMAVNDVLYVKPEHRGRAGLQLIRVAERALKAAGVVRVHYSTKVHATVGRRGHKTGDVLAKLGYRHDEQSYSKLL
jgi:GNAT superfamily N-acetyltransferase